MVKTQSFITPKYGDELEGTIGINTKGFGFVKVLSLEQSVEIPQHDLNTALHGDAVRLKITGKNKFGQFVGEVLEVIKRSKHGFAGTLFKEKNMYFVKAQDARMYTEIMIPESALNGAEPGLKVFAKITEWTDSKKSPWGVIHTVLGKPGQNDAEVSAYALERGFNTSFPIDVEEEARIIEEKGITEGDLKDRRDFRNVLTCTIDPFDAKDFDDALSFQKLPNGNYEIGVHIADVSHYVKEGSALDKEARERATSMYLVDRVIPMLPEVLSNNLCSLVEGKDRLTFSAVFEVNEDAEIVGSWYGRSVIHSQKRFSYEEAQEILDAGAGLHYDALNTLNVLAKKIQKRRFDNGALSLETEEVKFKLDDKGFPVSVYKKVRGDTHKMIEEWMLSANKGVATYVSKLPNPQEHTYIYRVHPEPEEDRMLKLANIFRNAGHQINFSNGIVPSKDINRILKSLEGTKEGGLLQVYVTRAMQKAIYSTDNVGHYGLAFDFYSHFTSPIRRYPDTLAHRLLATYLKGDHTKAAAKKFYEELCAHCSFREKEAADAERGSVKYMQVLYMSVRIGQTFNGVVSGVSQWGIYVEDSATKCEGMIKLRDLGSDFYVYDDKKDHIIGENTGEIFKLGDEMRIQVKGVNLEERLIDYARVVDSK